MPAATECAEIKSKGQISMRSRRYRRAIRYVFPLVSFLFFLIIVLSIRVEAQNSASIWGNNFYGQSGDGRSLLATTPLSVNRLFNASGISGGGLHSVAVKTDGTVRAWGDNAFFQLGSAILPPLAS